jgi:predicted GNAT superfamily acetyltransferase
MDERILDLREAPAAVRAGALALNATAEAETSPLDPARLDAMLAQALRAEARLGAEGEVRAFLIAFDQDAAYGSPNFLWFRDRLPRFAYVDRVVVAPAARGRGLARALYADCSTRSARWGLAASSARSTSRRRTRRPTPSTRASDSARPAARGLGAKTVRYLSCDVG